MYTLRSLEKELGVLKYVCKEPSSTGNVLPLSCVGSAALVPSSLVKACALIDVIESRHVSHGAVNKEILGDLEIHRSHTTLL